MINFKKLQHAYLLIGDRTNWKLELEKGLKEFFETDNLSSSPDVWQQDYESFGIKDAHALIEREARHGFGDRGRFFILTISSITPEAQNALLKTFEEPAEDAHFFILARSAEIFLPTLKSRMIILDQRGVFEVGLRAHLKSNFENGRNEVGLCATKSDFVSPNKFLNADHFLTFDFPDRLDFIQKEFLPARAGGKNKDITKSDIIDFVAELEKTFRAKVDMKKITKGEELALHELAKCQRYLQNPRSSNRLILEHLALTLPL